MKASHLQLDAGKMVQARLVNPKAIMHQYMEVRADMRSTLAGQHADAPAAQHATTAAVHPGVRQPGLAPSAATRGAPADSRLAAREGGPGRWERGGASRPACAHAAAVWRGAAQVKSKEQLHPPHTYEYNDKTIQPNYLNTTANLQVCC